MTTKRTPTLAELRKLAKKHGQDHVRIERFRRADDKPGTYPLLVIEVGTKIGKYGADLLMQVYPRTQREGQAMLFAALSALPDATKGGKR